MAKGIELPVNVLILVAIGVIVLIGLVVLLGVGIGGVSPAIVELERGKACGILQNTYKCDDSYTSSISVDKTRINASTLQGLCESYRDCAGKVKDSAGTLIERTEAQKRQCCAVNVCGCSP